MLKNARLAVKVKKPVAKSKKSAARKRKLVAKTRKHAVKRKKLAVKKRKLIVPTKIVAKEKENIPKAQKRKRLVANNLKQKKYPKIFFGFLFTKTQNTKTKKPKKILRL